MRHYYGSMSYLTFEELTTALMKRGETIYYENVREHTTF